MNGAFVTQLCLFLLSALLSRVKFDNGGEDSELVTRLTRIVKDLDSFSSSLKDRLSNVVVQCQEVSIAKP